MNEKAIELYNQLKEGRKNIVKLIALGYTSEEIAKKTGYSYHTIGSFRKEIYKCIQVNTDQQVTAFAISIGIVTAEEVLMAKENDKDLWP